MSLTPLQIAKARYDEATQIRDAWQHRYNVAADRNRLAATTQADQIQTRRELNAAAINLEDATTAHKLAQQEWIDTYRAGRKAA